jgi:hypothetical protein
MGHGFLLCYCDVKSSVLRCRRSARSAGSSGDDGRLDEGRRDDGREDFRSSNGRRGDRKRADARYAHHTDRGAGGVTAGEEWVIVNDWLDREKSGEGEKKNPKHGHSVDAAYNVN